MEQIHPLRKNETLMSSLSDDISDDILDNLLETKVWVEEYQEDWWKVAIVHLSWDIMTSSHIQYIQTIIAKLRKENIWPFKLLVWVEADTATEKRKEKVNIYSQEERRFMFENIKWVDRCYIEFEWLEEQNNKYRPAWIVKYLKPDVMVSHIEHIWEDEELVRQQCKQNWIDNLVVIKEWDEMKYLWEESMREKFNRSTTNTIRQIFELYRWNKKYDV